jgi:hypothetical protein
LMRSLIVLTFSVVTWTNSAPYNFRSPISSTSYHTRLHTGPSLLRLGDYCYTWTPPTPCVPPNFLQILAHMPVIGLPRLGWLFLTSHQFKGETQCSCPILSPRHIVCSTKVERWTWDLDPIQWILESHGAVPPRLYRSWQVVYWVGHLYRQE